MKAITDPYDVTFAPAGGAMFAAVTDRHAKQGRTATLQLRAVRSVALGEALNDDMAVFRNCFTPISQPKELGFLSEGEAVQLFIEAITPFAMQHPDREIPRDAVCTAAAYHMVMNDRIPFAPFAHLDSEPYWLRAPDADGYLLRAVNSNMNSTRFIVPSDLATHRLVQNNRRRRITSTGQLICQGKGFDELVAEQGTRAAYDGTWANFIGEAHLHYGLPRTGDFAFATASCPLAGRYRPDF